MVKESGDSVEKTGLYYARVERGLTQEELAKKVGSSRNTIIRLESGKGPPEGMMFTKVWAQKFEPILNYPASLLLFWDEESAKKIFADPDVAPRDAMFRMARVKTLGAVAAGVWREVERTDGVAPADHYAPLPADPDYPVDAQYDLIVVGTSINRVALDGYRLRVVDLAKTGRGYTENDLVIVERLDGHRVETTAKRVRRRFGDKEELWPDSDDPQWQSPIALDIPGQTIRVIGLVLYAYSPARRR